MLPLLTVGPWQIATYKVVTTLALIIATTYSFERLRTLHIGADVVTRSLLLTILGGAACMYLAAGIPYLRWRIDPSELPPAAGVSILWAIVGGGLTGVACCRAAGISLGQAFDLGVLPLPLGQAIGRLGCLAAGCCAGKETDSWLGMYLPDEHGVWAVRYPTQAISVVADLLIFVILLATERYAARHVRPGQSWPFAGFIVLLYGELFFLKRFLIAFLRESAVPIVGPVSQMHLLALAGLCFFSVLILRRAGQQPETTGSAATHTSDQGGKT